MTNLSEIFKLVPGFNDVEINGDGTVIIVDGFTRPTRINIFTGRPSRRVTTIYGERYQVGRLVARAFVDNPENKNIAIFLDADSMNCAHTNIIWGDDYQRHKIRMINRGGKGTIEVLITEQQAKEIARKLKSGITAKALAIEYNTSHATITRARKHYLKQKHGNRRYHRSTKEGIFDLFDKGYAAIDVAKMFDIRYETLYRWKIAGRKTIVNGASGHLRLHQIVIPK